MHARPFHVIGHFLGGRILFGCKVFAQIVTILPWDRKIHCDSHDISHDMMYYVQDSTGITKLILLVGKTTARPGQPIAFPKMVNTQQWSLLIFYLGWDGHIYLFLSFVVGSYVIFGISKSTFSRFCIIPSGRSCLNAIPNFTCFVWFVRCISRKEF